VGYLGGHRPKWDTPVEKRMVSWIPVKSQPIEVWGRDCTEERGEFEKKNMDQAKKKTNLTDIGGRGKKEYGGKKVSNTKEKDEKKKDGD